MVTTIVSWWVYATYKMVIAIVHDRVYSNIYGPHRTLRILVPERRIQALPPARPIPWHRSRVLRCARFMSHARVKEMIYGNLTVYHVK